MRRKAVLNADRALVRLSATFVAGLLVSCTAWGRSISVDLRAPVASSGASTTVARGARPRLLSTSAPAEGEDGTLRRVNLAAGTASVGDVDIGDELEFTLFDDVKITLRLTDRSPSLLEGDVFLAEASGYDGVKNAVVLRTAEGLTVDVQDFLKDRVYKVISTPDGVTVQEIEPVKDGVNGYDIVVPPEEPAVPGKAEGENVERTFAGSDAPLAVADGGKTYVDVLVAYDKNAVTWANSNGGGINSFAQTAIAKMNAALGNTGLNSYFQFRLAGVTTVNVTAPDVDTALKNAKNQVSGWEGIASKREEVGADIVTTLINPSGSQDYAGMGYSLSSESSLSSFASWAYNACLIRYVSESHTMTHEVGHNMGAGHSTAQKSSPGPQLYNYSAGYYFTGSDKIKYCTIMSYTGEGPGGTRVPFFSSPNHYYKSVKVGDSSHDNTRTIRNTYSYVAKWRTRKPDLKPYKPKAWSSPLVVSKSYSTATTSTDSKFLDSDNLYVSWAVECVNEDVTAVFKVTLYVDGNVKQNWFRTSIDEGYYTHEDGYNIGMLPVGTHTIKLVADSGSNVSESNENNNSCERTITVTRTPGSCEDAAVWLTMPSQVTTYGVTLVKEWLSGSYSSSSGAFFAQTSVASGRLYTIAMPKGSDFTVSCGDSSAKITYGVDDNLQYYLIDARSMKSSAALATLAIHGTVGAKATVYAVAADYMPLGSWNKPEVLPASGRFRYDVTRSLRSGIYSFFLNAEPGMRYEMRVSGRKGLDIDWYGEVEILDSTEGEGYDRILFSCPKGGQTWLDVYADETGAFSVMWVGVNGSTKFKLALDANGGQSSTPVVKAAFGDKVGKLPVPERLGHVFNGWYTAREGGTRVTADTVMTVASDLTLYAHWTALAAGSCEDAAIGFAMTDAIATYNVNLTRGWRADSASYGNDGVLCCVATVERGRFYTIAMPIGSSFNVECDDDGAVVTYGEDDNLSYCLVDTREMFEDSARMYLCIYGDIGERATVLAVAADYMPLGTKEKPEVLPADNAGKDFSYKVSRNLRNRCYEFLLAPAPDMIYELRVSGQQMVCISFPGSSEAMQVIEHADESACTSDFVVFTCSGNDPLTLSVSAATTGPVEVEWIGRRDKSMVRLYFDGSGGEPYEKWVSVARGKPVGSLPDAERSGFILDGWYTAKTGGTRVTESTVFNSGTDITLYARWKSLVLGSSFWAAVPFTMTADIRKYDITLTRGWDDQDGRYFDEGKFWCRSTFPRGGLYTFALPNTDPLFYVYYYNNGVEVSYGEDDALRYALVDTRKMSEDSTTIYFEIDGDVGKRATVYAVAADYLPLGSYGKPEVLPAKVTSTDGYFYYEVQRSLRDGSYDFILDAVPGVVYELYVSGKSGLGISFLGDSMDRISLLANWTYGDSAYVMFSSQSGGKVSIRVDADETGPVSVEWCGVLECDNCYDTQP